MGCNDATQTPLDSEALLIYPQPIEAMASSDCENVAGDNNRRQ